jgi:hypothetical protein
LRTDVFAFKCFNGAAYNGLIDTNLVQNLIYYGDRNDMANEIYFKPTSTIPDRLNFLATISLSGQMEKPYLTICKDTTSAIKDNKWYIVDDQILVNFINPNPDSNFIQNFCTANGLDLVHQPPTILNYDLNNAFSYTYIFKINMRYFNSLNYDLYIDKVRSVYTNNIGIVKNASPNITNFRNTGYNCLLRNEFFGNEESVACAPNDIDWDACWNLDNQGFQRWLEPPGTVGADVDICGCWEDNLSGENVKIALIGYGDVNFNNQEFKTTTFSADKWDCTSGVCTNTLTNNNNGSASLGTMSCIMGTTKNNFNYTAGIAEDATIVPFKIGDDFTSYSSLLPAFHEAANQNVDIIATDFFSEIENPNVRGDLYLIYISGRKDDITDIKSKMVIIAPAGEQQSVFTNSPGSTALCYPAAYNYDQDNFSPEVIGVIGSDRFDKKCDWELDASVGYVYQFSTNYGKEYEVAAPGPINFQPLGTNSLGVVNMSCVSGHFTSNSVATVAGILALMIQQSPKIKADELLNFVTSTSEKVGGYTYLNGRSDELAFGRINCTQLNHVVDNYIPDNIKNIANNANNLEVLSTDNSWIINLKSNELGEIKLYNLQGQVMFKTANHVGKCVINKEHLPNGIYILKTTKSSHAIKIFK